MSCGNMKYHMSNYSQVEMDPPNPHFNVENCQTELSQETLRMGDRLLPKFDTMNFFKSLEATSRKMFKGIPVKKSKSFYTNKYLFRLLVEYLRMLTSLYRLLNDLECKRRAVDMKSLKTHILLRDIGMPNSNKVPFLRVQMKKQLDKVVHPIIINSHYLGRSDFDYWRESSV